MPRYRNRDECIVCMNNQYAAVLTGATPASAGRGRFAGQLWAGAVGHGRIGSAREAGTDHRYVRHREIGRDRRARRAGL